MDQLDSQTLRLLLAVAGVFIIACVYIWGRYKAKVLDFIFQRGEYDELGLDQLNPKQTPSTPVRASGGITEKKAPPPPPPVEEEEMEDNEYFTLSETPKPASPPPAAESSRTAQLGAPFLIQISVVASDDGYFDGIELRDALEDLRLIYGDMGIYHRYDREYRTPLFSIASLVEPGTFPIKDMENFECPGIVLFFQPPQVDDPLAVFDDLVTTCHELAIRLGGEEWDEKRQALTQEKIAQMRARLREAY